jgi:hypothetical protein
MTSHTCEVLLPPSLQLGSIMQRRPPYALLDVREVTLASRRLPKMTFKLLSQIAANLDLQLFSVLAALLEAGGPAIQVVSKGCSEEAI